MIRYAEPVNVTIERAPAQERTLHHLVEYAGQIWALHGGKKIAELGAFHDGYGLDSLSESVKEELERLGWVYAVTAESSLVLVGFLARWEKTRVFERMDKDPWGHERPVYADGQDRITVPASIVEVLEASDNRREHWSRRLVGEPYYF